MITDNNHSSGTKYAILRFKLHKGNSTCKKMYSVPYVNQNMKIRSF